MTACYAPVMRNNKPVLLRALPLLLVLGLLSSLPSASLANLSRERQSVVKIYVTLQQEDFAQPWQPRPPVSGNGSGFILRGRRIMTNAHVVSDARFIEVQREGDTRRYPATVAFIGHDCDLAILTVRDDTFFSGTSALSFGDELPALNDSVLVLGYPMGGDRLSLTKGVVSRIDYSLYTHSTVDAHLVMQVDAAINPGNSGGPVLFNDKVVGVAFQGIMGAQNLGYTIPLPVLNHFLTDIEDGQYDGYPELGIEHMPLLNAALRADLGVPTGMGGVVAWYVDPFGAAASLVKAGDVLLSIDGHPIAEDGSVRLDNNRVEYAEFTERKQCNERIILTLWRDHQTKSVVIPLTPRRDPFLFRQTYDEKPEYLIVGGLVFSPLSRGYLATLGSDLNTPPAQHLLYLSRYAKLDNLYKGRKQFVVLSSRLPHPVNTYSAGHLNHIVASVNGVAIHEMKDLPPALKQGRNGFHVIRFEGSDNPLILDAAAAEAADQDILDHYGIPSAQHIAALPEHTL